MATVDDSDVPETGAVFTFGRSRFADNLANKFWIRNDRIVHVTCGDEHSVVVTERGRLYAFGTNDWGQLGLGHTKAANKPSFLKVLKPNKMVLAACGRTHTIVASESGKIFSFGAGGDGQLGHGNTDDQHSPKQIEGLPVEKVKILSCGVYHSAALFESGDLYTWGSGSDGQTGHEEEETLAPKLLKFDGKVKWISCGYYHTAAVTDDGKLYTFGENENGKLGITGSQETSRPQPVATEDGHFVAVACGSGHTVALTKEGKVFSFGDGSRGQLGQGTRTQELCEPKMVQQLSHLKMKFISCGDCHSAAITENGKLYTFGDGRHGKLAQGEECFSNLFRPQIVARFAEFNVQSVSCGGCHTLVIATMREHDVSDVEDEEDGALNSSMMSSYSHASMPEANATMRLQSLSNTVPLVSPRDKRRQKESENLANSFSGSFRHVSKNDLPAIGLSLDRGRLPCINKLKDLPEKEDKTNQTSNKKKNEELFKSSGEGKSTDSKVEEKNIKNSQKVSDELEFKKNLENELDDNDSRNIKSKSTDGHKHVQIKENERDQSRISDKKETLESKSKGESEEEEDESGDEEESEEEEEGSEEEEEEDEDSNAKIDRSKSDKSSKPDVSIEKIKAPSVTKKPEDLKKKVEEEEEEEEEEDDDEDDDEESGEEDEDEEEEEEDDDDDDEEEDDDDDEEDEEEEDEEEAKVTDGKVEALVSDSKVDGKSVEGDIVEIETDKSSKEDKNKDKGDKNKDKEDKKKDKEEKSKGKKKDKQDKKKGKDDKVNEEHEDKDVNDKEELNSKGNDDIEAEKNNNNLEDADRIENTEDNKATTEEDKKKEKPKFGGIFGRKKQPTPVAEKSKDEIDGPAATPKKTGKSGVCTVI